MHPIRPAPRWLAAALLVLSGCRGGGGPVTVRDADLPAHASRAVRRALGDVAGRVVVLRSDFGRILVRSLPDAIPAVEARIRVQGRTEAEARAALSRFDVAVERRDGRVVVRRTGEPVPTEDGRLRVAPLVDLAVTLPPGAAVDIDARSGDVELAGPFAHARVAAHFGDVAVAGPMGTRLEVVAGSGEVALRGVVAREARVVSQFGDVEVDGFRGSLDASAGSGDVRVRGFDGASCVLASDSGRVVADGRFAGPLRVASGSGDVGVAARAGSGARRGWRLESRQGDVELAVPPDLGAAWRARTRFGAVRVDGAADGPAAAEGVLGDGGAGAAIELVSGSGDVRLRASRP